VAAVVSMVWSPGRRSVFFYCPGCNGPHYIPVTAATGPLWDYNWSLDKPTLSPSLGINMDEPERRCHSFMKDGKLEYLSDSFHSLAGTTVDMQPLTDEQLAYL
jgi:Family of unknown function (DUF6527)